jgi:hypothetical protein
MKTPILPRAAVLSAAYPLVFILLVVIQFSHKESFSLRIGDLGLSGVYRQDMESEAPVEERALQGGVILNFGGMEFRLKGNDGLSLLTERGEQYRLDPQGMRVEENQVRFRLRGNTELVFALFYIEGVEELRITGILEDGLLGVEIPFRPLPSSGIRESGEGFVILADGRSYAFSRTEMDLGRRRLILSRQNPAAMPILYYRPLPEERPFNPADYVLAQSAPENYRALLSQWRESAFALWARSLRSANDEGLVMGYLGESLKRGTLKTAVNSVPSAFLNGGRRSYVSSVYLGRMSDALRSLSAAEQRERRRFSGLLAGKAADFLEESHGIAYLGSRRYEGLLDQAAELVKTLDPASLSLKMIPGILEGWVDWYRYCPSRLNPYEAPARYALQQIIPCLWQNGSLVLAGQDGAADLALNLRLGLALDQYAQTAGLESSWGALGRSLVLSTLSQTTSSGSIPPRLSLRDNGGYEAQEAPQGLALTATYHLLEPEEYKPRAVGIGASSLGIWAWYGGGGLTATVENNVLDIVVSFPPGETHFMLIRGLGPFSRLQLHNQDFRTAPDFERYPLGWVYNAAEQTLLLKLDHRQELEHIRIFLQ